MLQTKNVFKVISIILCVIAIVGIWKGIRAQVAFKAGTKIGDVRVNTKDGALMVWVPAGEFLMGSKNTSMLGSLDTLMRNQRPGMLTNFDRLPKNDVQPNMSEPHAGWPALPDEYPQHSVYLDGYWIYKYEVTVAQYRKFCSETGKPMPMAPEWGWIEDHPIVNVNWQDAVEYAKWAGASLPTEAQWEKAARGETGQKYPWGEQWDASKCNYGSKWPNTTQPVGSYPTGASPYGCMDMVGNAEEWCADWYGGYDQFQPSNKPSRNPTGPENGMGRILRGGGFYSSDWTSRCASRYCHISPNANFNYYGFRLVSYYNPSFSVPLQINIRF